MTIFLDDFDFHFFTKVGENVKEIKKCVENVLTKKW